MEEFLPPIAENDEELMLFDFILHTNDRKDHHLDKQPGVFDLEKLTDSFCYVHKADIPRLVAAFNIPEQIILKTGAKVKGVEAMCILLKRLAHPNRYADMMQFFPKGRSLLSETFNYLINRIIKDKEHVLTNVNPPWLTNARIRKMCQNIHNKGSPYKHCFGFIDGTVKSICRPKMNSVRFDKNQLVLAFGAGCKLRTRLNFITFVPCDPYNYYDSVLVAHYQSSNVWIS